MFLGIAWIEWFGYAASVVVAISLMMSSIVKLRWFNLTGATMFSAYGFVIGAWPVGFLNLFIVAINIIGGILIGVVQHKVPLSQPASSYTIMTIGDGLVSQVPALVISSVARDLLQTRQKLAIADPSLRPG